MKLFKNILMIYSLTLLSALSFGVLAADHIEKMEGGFTVKVSLTSASAGTARFYLMDCDSCEPEVMKIDAKSHVVDGGRTLPVSEAELNNRLVVFNYWYDSRTVNKIEILR